MGAVTAGAARENVKTKSGAQGTALSLGEEPTPEKESTVKIRSCLRARMPHAIITEISPRAYIVGFEPLLAIGDIVATARNDLNGRTIVIIPVGSIIVVIGTGERTADADR